MPTEEAASAEAPVASASGVNNATATPETTPSKAPVVDADTAALLQLLGSEVERLTVAERNAKVSAELRDRDGVRASITARLAQEQIVQVRLSNAALTTQLEEARAAAAKAAEAAASAERQLAAQREESRFLTAKLASAETDAASAFEAKRCECERLQGSLGRVRKELEDRTTALATAVKDAEARDRAAYETRVALEVRLKERDEEAGFVEDMRRKETRAATAREYELSQLVTTLRRQLTEAWENGEADRRVQTELAVTLRVDCESLRLRAASSETQAASAERDAQERTQRLRTDLAAAQDALGALSAASSARERALEVQTARLVSDLRSAQAEVNAMAEREGSAGRDHIAAAVQLTAQRDALSRRVDALTAETEDLRRQLHDTAVAAGTERAAAERVKGEAQRAAAAALAAKTAEAVALASALTSAESRLKDTQAALDAATEGAAAAADKHAAQAAALAAERDGYKSSVAKLEAHIRDNYAYRLLEEQNESLRQQATSLRAQVTHLNATLASLRTEADISESYRLKMLQEQLSSQLGRLASLEKERRLARPLLQDLTETVRRLAGPGGPDPALARDMDMFFRQFGSVSA